MPTDLPAEPITQRAAQLARGATVHVVEDNPGVRLAFELVLRKAGLNAVSHGSAEAFLGALPRVTEPVACVVTDLRMAGLDGTGMLRQMRAMGFDQPVIVVTGRGDAQTAVRAMKDGAADFIEKPCTSARLIHAVAMALSSQKQARSGADHQVRDAARAQIAKLTSRENQVLALLAVGHPNKEVARMLGLSPRTVEIHRARMMDRLGVDSFAAAVRIAVQADMPLADQAAAPKHAGEVPRLRAG